MPSPPLSDRRRGDVFRSSCIHHRRPAGTVFLLTERAAQRRRGADQAERAGADRGAEEPLGPTGRARQHHVLRAERGQVLERALPSAPVVRPVTADREGYVTSLGALAVGVASIRLGAGRVVKNEPIDHAVGIVCLRKRGDRVDAGDVLAEVHARDVPSARAVVDEVREAYELVDEAPAPRSVILETLS